jgi:maleylacetate reductase
VAGAFTWRDGERWIRFGAGLALEAHELAAEGGLHDYALLTTKRHEDSAAGLAGAAARVLHVPDGRVDEISAELLRDAGERSLVALGGGRVIDTAKAIAGATGVRCAALPTTLSGAEMTGFHRTPRGADGARLVRPALVLADPELMVSAPGPRLAASAMNALAHAMEALYAPLTAPVPELAALRAAELIADQLPRDDPDRSELALGAVLAGYAAGSAGIAVHHAVCQTIVRVCGTPHAETNAVMLPHFARLMAGRAPGALGQLAAALGDPAADPAAAGGRIAKLAARSGHTRLATLGVAEEQLPAVARDVQAHPALAATPEPPGEDELRGLLQEDL